MRTLPKPLPDELVYSTLARATYRYGLRSPKRYLELLYGRRTVLAVPDLPTNLAKLAEAAQDAWQLSATEIAARHTLLGYFTHFGGKRRRAQALAGMTGDGGHLHVRLGVCAGSARSPDRFQLCLRCHAADMHRFGEAYWHRAHHLPGIVVCHLHGDPLHETQIPYRPAGRHEYVPAPLDLSMVKVRPIALRPARVALAQAVAARSVELLESERLAALPDYRDQLAQIGFAVSKGTAARLEGAFGEFFGMDLIASSFREGASGLAWVRDLLRGPTRNMHPLKHVLAAVFLGGQTKEAPGPTEVDGSVKTWGLYRDPRMRDEAASLARLGLRTHAVAQALEVDWKTAHRLLQPIPSGPTGTFRSCAADRDAWCLLANSHPELGKKELRARAQALYARLYRHDKEWLLAWTRPPARSSTVARRVDWDQRDRDAEQQVRQHAVQIQAESPPRRASRSRLLGELGLRALVAHRAVQLPRTCAALAEVCESVEMFQLRRVEQVLSRSGSDQLPAWSVLRAAGVLPSRLPDGGRALLQTAANRGEQGQTAGAEFGGSR